MLTSKLITEIIENHSELYECANSFNKFVSNQWRTQKIFMRGFG